MRIALLATVLLTAVGTHADVLETKHADVTFTGVDRAYAQAIADVLAAARKIYLDEFAADLPEKFFVQVTCARGEPTRLYTDGQDHVSLSVPSVKKLAQPSASGVHNVYGMCHELGHMVMYRVLKDRDWLTSAAAEGWAHYAGSVVVDGVFAELGADVWPDPHDYRDDGLQRLAQQLAADKPSEITRAAGMWQELEELVGRPGLVKLFGVWQRSDIDATAPQESVLAGIAELHPKSKDRLDKWWETAGPLLVEPRARSAKQAVRARATQLTGKPLILGADDDSMEGRKSIAGGGHARKFASPGGGDWYLRAVWVYGARYGRPREASRFDVALCDTELKSIASAKKPYTSFSRGDMEWVRLEVTPTRVPAEFYVCLNFRPTATKGVYVAFDDSTQGNSLVGTPGKPGSSFDAGDWMIRAELDQLKSSDALGD